MTPLIIADLLGMVFGSVEGIAMIVLLLSAGRWLRKTTLLADWVSVGGLFAIFLGILAATGAVDLRPDVIVDLGMTVWRLATNLLGGFL